jgi:hypothetical protein
MFARPTEGGDPLSVVAMTPEAKLCEYCGRIQLLDRDVQYLLQLMAEARADEASKLADPTGETVE